MVTSPGLRQQSGVRTFLRVGGTIVSLIALGLVIGGMASFFQSFNAEPFSEDSGPGNFWMVFAGLPLLAAGGWMLQAGFLGAASRYVAGEAAPVLKDTASYLTDGAGILGIGKEQPGAAASGPYCSTCGVRNDAGARFCDACGTALP